ncbi:MAG TPA: pentapeptide repeat-containing protein [Arsenophonus sp.]
MKEGKIDLSNINLSGKNLSGIYLEGANLENANMMSSTFNKAKLIQTNLNGAKLEKVAWIYPDEAKGRKAMSVALNSTAYKILTGQI